MAQTLTPLPGAYAIARFPVDAALPAGPSATLAGLWSVTRTMDEVSLVARAHAIPADAERVDRPWTALKLEGPFDLTGETGVIASVARPIAQARISVFAMATFDTDYVLVPAGQAGRVRAALTAAGHEVRVPATRIRPVAAADADGVARLVWEGFLGYLPVAPDGWDPGVPEPQADRLDRPGTRWLLAEDGDGYVRGSAGAIATEDEQLGHVWQLFVDPGLHGTGLADALLDAVVETTRADGRRALQLYVARDATQARAFYARRGFAPDPADDGRPGPGGLPVVRLRRAL
ncbi:GNAT family N-acetyltransferase [Conexibacter sp. W3-3-2]|uniref:GNAT family N-acetyltransferase n=1 Tax=Conexibacter sp. W3-3-2 TaxID=2675227 RepID=UPI0012B70332|nr:GNAT family N-acetyltransferase [Conexibacter sp. W3-3-2]MTD45138.1 GNAT family N-acetyltransferase [Conexibacter sp. W3-3-2]